MPLPFRDVPKESMEFRLPIPLATQIREKAARERRSLSEVLSEITIRGLGHEPASYGIEPHVVAAAG